MNAHPDKFCVACGRSFNWRKKWARNWDDVKYCSDACRRKRGGGDATDAALESAIVDLLANCRRGETICPSEAAKKVAPSDWRPLMEPARRAARRLVMAGRIVVTQQGKVVDAATVRGPIRLRNVY